jgi:hypothetical protein
MNMLEFIFFVVMPVMVVAAIGTAIEFGREKDKFEAEVAQYKRYFNGRVQKVTINIDGVEEHYEVRPVEKRR